MSSVKLSTGEWAQHIVISVSWFQGSMLGVMTKAQADENCLVLSNSSDSSFLDTETCRQWLGWLEAATPLKSLAHRGQCLATERHRQAGIVVH